MANQKFSSLWPGRTDYTPSFYAFALREDPENPGQFIEALVSFSWIIDDLDALDERIDDVEENIVALEIDVEDLQANKYDASNPDEFITEANVTGTSRQYTKGQAGTNVPLAISEGVIALDLTAGNFYTLTLDANAELQLPTTDRPQAIQVLVFNDGGNTLTFASGYVVFGTPSTTDEDYILLHIACAGNNQPWVTVLNKSEV